MLHIMKGVKKIFNLYIIVNLLRDYLIFVLNCRKVHASVIMQHIKYSRKEIEDEEKRIKN